LELLHEIGRMRMSALEILAALEHDLGLRVCFRGPAARGIS
jgi:hypothetical protein